MEFIQLLAVVYGSLTALCVVLVLTSRSAIFKPMVEGFIACVQIALNMFTNNTYKVGHMEMEAIPSRKANHDRLSQEIEEAGNKMWAAWDALKASISGWLAARKEDLIWGFVVAIAWCVERCVDVVIWWDAKIEAGKAKIESFRSWCGEKVEDAKMWWTGLFLSLIHI